MPREKESYRDNLELLLEAFPNQKLLSPTDVSRWAGKDRRSMKKLYFGSKPLISIAELARRIS